MAVITVTERAIEKIKELCHHNHKYAVRLSIKGGGCAGYSYDWGFADQSDFPSHARTRNRLFLVPDKTGLYPHKFHSRSESDQVDHAPPPTNLEIQFYPVH